MNVSDEIEQLKDEILSGPESEKEKFVDRLIELGDFEETWRFIQSLFLIGQSDRNLIGVAAYGVKRLSKLTALKTVREFKFCPQCKSPLSKYDIIDPYLIGLKCSNDHRFHVAVQQNEGYDIDLRVVQENYIDVAKEWLTNERFRNNIHAQIAEILRKYIDLNELNNQDSEQNDLENYCPVCALDLKEFEQDDVWVKGLKCPNEHIFLARNGLTYNNTTLKPDINKTIFYFLIDAYLGDEQRAHLPDQIINLFTSIK